MKKLQNKMRKLRKNNKGFTLVELIIVIAIIAILTTVFAPMYTKYVDEAREANDVRTASSIMQAAATAVVDTDFDGSGIITVTWDGADSLTAAGKAGADAGDPAQGTVGNLIDTIGGIIKVSELKVESTDVKGKSLVFDINSETGEITVAEGDWKKLIDDAK